MLQAITGIKHWMIDETFAVKWQGIIEHRLRNGKDLPEFRTDYALLEENTANAHFKMGFDHDFGFQFYLTEHGNVARIPLKGVMTYAGDLCSYGTKEIAEMIEQVNASDDYIGAVLVIDSPGGDGESVEVLQLAILNSEKPIVGWIEKTAASAAIWATTPTDFLMASSERFNTIGSIGGYMMYQNIAGALENEGIEVKIIRAPQSTNKVTINSIEPLTGELEAEMVAELESFVNYFISDVKEYRAVTDDGKVFTGKTYSGQEALELGLVDRIGSLEHAIGVVSDIASIQKPAAASADIIEFNKELKSDIDMKFSDLLNKIFGGETTKELTLSDRLAEVLNLDEQELKVSEEAAEAFENLEAMITGFEAQLQTQAEAIAEKQAEIERLDKELLEEGQDVEALEAKMHELEAEIETLKQAPARNHTAVASDKDVVAGDDGQVKVLSGYKAAEAQAKQARAKRLKKETQPQV
jgi:protease-4